MPPIKYYRTNKNLFSMKNIIFTLLIAAFHFANAQTVPCKNSYDFKGGANDKITLPFNHALYDTLGFTWEAWIWIDSVPTGSAANPNPNKGQVVIAAADATNCADIGFALGWGNWAEDKLIFTADGDGCVRDPNPPSYTGLVSKTWYHVAGVADYTGGWAYLYVDGQMVSSSNYFGLTPAYKPFPQTVVTNIGNLEINNSGFGFNGYIDEVRIWNTIRTSSDIQNNMFKCLKGDEAGLVAYYNAQHTSTTVATDLTSNQYNGTFFGNATTTANISPDLECCREGACLGSYGFTGTDGQMISLPANNALYNINGFTWEAWIKPANIPTGFDTLPNSSKGQVIISAADGTNCADIGLSFGWGNWAEHRLIFTADGAGCARDPNPPSYVGFQNNMWYHVAAVADYGGGTANLYVNGNLVSSSNYFGITSSYTPFTDIVSVQIGNLDYGAKTFPFNGLIDEVRIWNTVRTANQIATSKDACLTGNETGLVAYYKANEQSSDTAYDEKGIYHGELLSTVIRNSENAPLACCGSVGIEDITQQQVKIYPNPASNKLYMELSHLSLFQTVKVYNLLGSEVIKTALQGNFIDISRLLPGVYVLEVAGNRTIARTKFVIE
jgi:hypothetical protein